MAKRKYSSNVGELTLSAQLTNSSSSLTATLSSTNLSTLPSEATAPYTLVIDPDTANEEVVTVLSRSGNTITISRDAENNGLKNHDAGAKARHMITARDLQESQDHIDATGAYTINNPKDDPTVTGSTITKSLHGLTSIDGNVVGTSKSQTLTNKTIDGSSNTLTNVTTSSLIGNLDQSRINSLVSDLALKAPLNSPTFTGTVTLPSSSIVESYLQNNSVTTNKIVDLNVTTAKIADLNVTTGKIADSAITTTKIFNGAVDASKISTDAITTIKIADSAVTSAKIADGTITSTDISPTAGITPSQTTLYDATSYVNQVSITDGTTRRPVPFATAAGSVSSGSGTVGANTGIKLFTFTFSANRFTQAPLIVATISSGTGSTASLVARTVNATTTGFDLWVYNASSSSVSWSSTLTIDWIAIQMKSSSSTNY